MEFGVLGPIEVVLRGHGVSIGHPRQRMVLAVLLVEPNRTVSSDSLIDRVWDDDPPHRVRNVLSAYVSRLRKAIADAAPEVELARRSRGYMLTVDPSRVDLHVFRRMVSDAQAADEPAAEELLGRASRLWRGPAFADATSRWLADLRETLEYERLAAVLRANEIALNRGRHADLVGELHELRRTHRLDERVVAQLMLALYRGGRSAEALAVYTDVRRELRDELALEPGPELRGLQRRILNNDSALLQTQAVSRAPAVTPLVPRQLRAGTGDFTGRAADVAVLDRVLAEADVAVKIIALEGTPGVGKTALALHWAHRVADRFPGGQLFVDLRGHARQAPATAVEALTLLLRSLGVPPEQVPLNVEEAAVMYRSLLSGRRVLIVLDDALNPDQIRPLLPGSPTCMVLATSRNRLSGLVAKDGAHRHVVGTLSDGEAFTLLTRIVGENRVGREAEHAADLAVVCVNLPLALRIAAANLATHPHRAIADYVGELRAGDRLGRLRVDGDEGTAVRAAFTPSYLALEPQARLVFARLGTLIGTDFGAAVTALLVDVPLAHATRLLDRLVAAHLVEQTGPDRYRLHDLLRVFAEEVCHTTDGEEQREAITSRVLDSYVRSVRGAAELLYPQMLRLPDDEEHPASPEFADHAAASAWLDVERANLIAVIRHTAEHGPHQVAWRVADALRGYFWLRRTATEWMMAGHAALEAATADGHVAAQAAAHLNLGDAHWSLGQHRDALAHYRQAVASAAHAGWVTGHVSVLGNMASVHVELGELRDAEDLYLRALDLNRRTGRTAGDAMILNNLGNIHWELGALASAAEELTQARALHDGAGMLVPQLNALATLGAVLQELGDTEAAEDCLRRSLAMCEDLGDRGHAATVHDRLAVVHRDTARLTEALHHARTAVELARQVGGRRIEAAALNTLGTVLRLLDRSRDAADQHERALRLSRESSDRRGQVEALLGLAELALVDPRKAIEHAARALDISEHAGYRTSTGRAHTVLANAHRLLGAAAVGVENAETAVAVQRDTGHRRGLADAELALALCRGLADAVSPTG